MEKKDLLVRFMEEKAKYAKKEYSFDGYLLPGDIIDILSWKKETSEKVFSFLYAAVFDKRQKENTFCSGHICPFCVFTLHLGGGRAVKDCFSCVYGELHGICCYNPSSTWDKLCNTAGKDEPFSLEWCRDTLKRIEKEEEC